MPGSCIKKKVFASYLSPDQEAATQALRGMAAEYDGPTMVGVEERETKKLCLALNKPWSGPASFPPDIGYTTLKMGIKQISFYYLSTQSEHIYMFSKGIVHLLGRSSRNLSH